MAVTVGKVKDTLEYQAAVGKRTDTAADTVNTATIVALLRQIQEAVNKGTGTAIGANLSLVDLIGAFDGGADPQGDVYQALGVDVNNSIVDLLGAFDGGADPQGDIFQALGVDTTDSVKALIDAVKAVVDAINAKTTGGSVVRKDIAFDGTTGNGEIGTVALFTVTGDVRIKVSAICTETCVGAGSIEVGIAGATATIIAQLVDATDLVTGEIWHDPTPDASIELSSVFPANIIAAGADVILTVGSANVTDGTITFVAEWEPLSTDGAVVAAT